MSSRIFGRTLSVKSLLGGAAICAVFALFTPSLRAAQDITGDQAAIQAALTALVPTNTPTINTATAAQLESAVAKAISTSGSAGDIASAALDPYPYGQTTAKVRADRNTTAALVAGAAITQLITESDVNFATDVYNVANEVVLVSAGVTADDLTAAGQTAVVNAVIGKISAASVANPAAFTPAQFAAADEAIGLTPSQAQVTLELASLNKTTAATISISTANYLQIVAAVNAAVLSNTTSGVTPATLAASPFVAPYPPLTSGSAYRADVNTTGPLVAAGAIQTLITEGTDSSFSTDVGNIVTTLVGLNIPNTLDKLTPAGETAIVNAAIGKISAASVATTTQYTPAQLLTADEDIGLTTSQSEVDLALASLNKTTASTISITTANYLQLVAAVDAAVLSNTLSGVTPATLVTSVYAAYPPQTSGSTYRADVNTTGALVGAGAIQTLITEGTDSSFSTDVGNIVNSLVNLSIPVAADKLTAAGETAIVNAAIGKISAASVATTTQYTPAQLLAADEDIGLTASQSEVDLKLASLNKTTASTISITTANYLQLVAAVDAAVLSNTLSGVTPATLVTSVYAAYPPLTSGSTYRADVNTTGALVGAGAIQTLITEGTDSSFSTDVGNIVNSLVNLSIPVAADKLTAAGETAIVNAAIGKISAASVATTTQYTPAQLLAADEDIGLTASQSEVDLALASLNKTTASTISITTANYLQLVAAVDAAVLSNTLSGVTPATLVTSVYAAYPPQTSGSTYRADVNTTGALVGAGAIQTLITEGTDSSFSTDVGSIVHGLVNLTIPVAADKLTAAGETAIVNAAIGKISVAYAAGPTSGPGYTPATLIAADEAIGLSPSQAEVTVELASLNKTTAATISISTASYLQLVAAVDAAVTSNATSGVTPATLAASVYAFYPPLTSGSTVRADRAVSAPAVVEGVISQLLTNGNTANTPAQFATYAGQVTESVAAVNGTNTAGNLTLATREAVVEDALEVLANAYSSIAPNVTNFTQQQVLAADQTIGADITADPVLSAQTASGLTTLLQTAIAGITGTKATATAAAPWIAENFVAGILSANGGAAPNGATLPAFAVSILKNVYVNANVDELVAYQVGLQNNNQATLVSTGTTLFSHYPTAEAKITQGLAAAIPVVSGSSDANRVAFVTTLTDNQLTAATPILEGAVFVDPFYAADFAGAVMGQVYSSTTTVGTTTTHTGYTLLATDAPTIATGIGSILGQDGDALAQVSGTFAQFVAAGQLPVASAATYATNLITGAVTSIFPAADFLQITGTNPSGQISSGGSLKVTSATILPETVTDFEAIEDQFADAIITADGSLLKTQAGATTVASLLGTLALDIASHTKGVTFTPTGSSTTAYVAQYLAGSLAEYLDSGVLSSTPFSGTTSALSLAIADIKADIIAANGAAVTTAVDNAISAAAASSTAYAIYGYGSITTDETAITDR
jgi:uncharacterized membrane protein YcgQ (UPF0703/DUF1980 family)